MTTSQTDSPVNRPHPPTPIQVIGIGLDGAQGLSADVLQKIAQATILVGSSRHLDYFPDHPAQRLQIGNLNHLMTQLQTYLQEPNPGNIVILASGDPLFFGLGRLLLEALPSDQISFHPHLSSVQLAFSRLKRPWQNACIISIHGRSWEPLITALKRGEETIAIITDPQYSPVAIATLIQELGLPSTYQLWICENLGGDTEQVRSFSTAELSKSNTQQTTSGSKALELSLQVAPLHLVILVRQQTQFNQPVAAPILGINDSDFASFPDRPGLMTKREIRAIILANLNLRPGQTIWDIGAGTGSVSIEIARLVPTAQIYAIEKTAIGITLIHQNSQRFGLTNIRPIQGTAPLTLESLPQPDRVFIGGSGGQLSGILDHAYHHLKPMGQIVSAFATLESMSELMRWTQKHPELNIHLLQLNVSRSVTVGSQHRFSPLNPVTLATIELSKN